MKRVFQRLNAFLSDETIVIVDIGVALFGAADLFIHRRTEFLGPAYDASMGFAVPAAVGAQLANPALRPLVIVGDGAFQMTGMEISTAVRQKLNPIVVVLNNAGYGTERHIHNGPYNDILSWEYSRIPEVLGSGRGFVANTEAEFDQSLRAAKVETARFCVIDVRLDPWIDLLRWSVLRKGSRRGSKTAKRNPHRGLRRKRAPMETGYGGQRPSSQSIRIGNTSRSIWLGLLVPSKISF